MGQLSDATALKRYRARVKDLERKIRFQDLRIEELVRQNGSLTQAFDRLMNKVKSNWGRS